MVPFPRPTTKVPFPWATDTARPRCPKGFPGQAVHPSRSIRPVIPHATYWSAACASPFSQPETPVLPGIHISTVAEQEDGAHSTCRDKPALRARFPLCYRQRPKNTFRHSARPSTSISPRCLRRQGISRPAKATCRRLSGTPGDTADHVVPSADFGTVPFSPTARKTSFRGRRLEANRRRRKIAGSTSRPSGEVSKVPLSPDRHEGTLAVCHRPGATSFGTGRGQRPCPAVGEVTTVRLLPRRQKLVAEGHPEKVMGLRRSSLRKART